MVNQNIASHFDIRLHMVLVVLEVPPLSLIDQLVPNLDQYLLVLLEEVRAWHVQGYVALIPLRSTLMK